MFYLLHAGDFVSYRQDSFVHVELLLVELQQHDSIIQTSKHFGCNLNKDETDAVSNARDSTASIVSNR